MAHGVIRTDNLGGTDVAADLINIVYKGSGSTDTAIDNGNVVKVGDYIEKDVFKGVTPAATDTLDSIAIVCAPERTLVLEDWENKAGAVCRCYRLRKGYRFSLTADAIDGTAAKDKILELKAGTKLAAVDSLTQSSTRVGHIYDTETVGHLTYYMVIVD